MSKSGIFVGLSTIDIIYDVTEAPRRNQKITAKSQEIIVGGPATNAAITFSFLGGTAALVAPVGQSSLASTIKDECERFGIRLIDITPNAGEAPPVSSVWVDAEGQRSVVSANTAGRKLSAERIDHELIANAQVVMVDGHAMEACQAWAEAARENGRCVVLDGGSWKPGTERLLKSVDVAICSADFRPPACKPGEDALVYLCGAGVRDVAITHGAGSIEFVSQEGSGKVEVPRVRALDTTGAGDVLHGAFCFYVQDGCRFEEALAKAARIASESCRYRGTREWMRNLGSMK